MVMKLKLLGVRGSRPTHKRGLLGYGGNSTSFEFPVEGSDFHLFLDGGSGLAHRGRSLGERPSKKKFYFLITHTHWDHILGFPFFEPFYNDDNEFTFYASNTSKSTFNKLFFGLHRADNLPVPSTQLKAKIDFKGVQPGETFMIENKVKVTTYQINHQGITLAYRIQHGNDDVAIVTDNAPIEDGNYLGENMIELSKGREKEFEKEFNDGLVAFLKGCNTVVFDTHFTEANLKPDWGHSTPDKALEICTNANVNRLILFHHAPEDLDDHVLAKVQSILDKALLAGVEVVAAKEGDEWTLHCA
jgi:ribonuclease BN (tRNA processing enzyme)